MVQKCRCSAAKSWVNTVPPLNAQKWRCESRRAKK